MQHKLSVFSSVVLDWRIPTAVRLQSSVDGVGEEAFFSHLWNNWRAKKAKLCWEHWWPPNQDYSRNGGALTYSKYTCVYIYNVHANSVFLFLSNCFVFSRITDAFNNSRDRVRYLETLCPHLEALLTTPLTAGTSGTPLTSLMTAIRQMDGLSRAYAKSGYLGILFTKVYTVLPRTDAHAFNKLNLKRMLKAPRTDAHVLLFENVRLLLNCLRCNLVVCV